jgi:hypothetical protein
MQEIVMSTDLHRLAARIKRLEDIEEIRNLKSRYHFYINDCLYDRVGELFTEDAVIDMGYLHPSAEPWRGRKEITHWYNVLSNGSLLTQLKQFTHNHIIEVNGEEGSGASLLEARYGRGTESYNVAAKYMETYHKVDGVWLFHRMSLQLYFSVPLELGWAAENRHHLVQRPDYVLPEGVNVLKPTGPV